MKTPKNLKEMTDLHLEDHAILLEMLHALAEHCGVHFKPVKTEDGFTYEIETIEDFFKG